jgi:hypothetical protein
MFPARQRRPSLGNSEEATRMLTEPLLELAHQQPDEVASSPLPSDLESLGGQPTPDGQPNEIESIPPEHVDTLSASAASCTPLPEPAVESTATSQSEGLAAPLGA